MASTTRILVVALLFMPAALGAAPAEQFVAADVTYEHNARNTSHGHYYLKPSATTPRDWHSPVDYTTGTVFLHIEVYTKPTDAASKVHACFIQGNPGYACSGYSQAYTQPGTYKWASKMDGLYRNGVVDWSKGIPSLTIILTDDTPRNIGLEDVAAAVTARYLPSRLRVVITVVSAGGTYVPPTPREDPGPAADAGAPRPDASSADRIARNDQASPAAPPPAPDSPAPPPSPGASSPMGPAPFGTQPRGTGEPPPDAAVLGAGSESKPTTTPSPESPTPKQAAPSGCALAHGDRSASALVSGAVALVFGFTVRRRDKARSNTPPPQSPA